MAVFEKQWNLVEPALDVPATEAAGGLFPDLRRDAHLLEPIIRRAERDPGRAVASSRNGDSFVDVNAADFWQRVRELAKGLLAAGFRPGERVALLSRSRLEWLLVDYAILATGAVTVPIYETAAPGQVRHIVGDSGSIVAVVETAAMRATLTGTGTDALLRVPPIVIDDGGLDDLAATGRDIADAALDDRIGALTVDDTATIIYTSGTTGDPKGCVLTHGNLRANTIQSLDAVAPLLGPDERSLLFLPLAHAFAKVIALVGVEHGSTNIFATDMASLQSELPLAQPTMIVAVPRVFEKVFDGARTRSQDRARRRIFDLAADTATSFAKQRASGRVRLGTRLAHGVFDRIVYRKIRAAFGGSLRFAFSGASPLGERLTYFFDGVGIRIFEGYGLTETSPVLTVNRADAWVPGTVGPPVCGTRVRIAADGEILAAGPQVFTGYWANEEATAAALTADGWLRTGDLGELAGGFLRITGRKKEIIVTAGGKNVAPAPMEDELRAHPLIDQAVVIGDNRPFVAALVTLDPEGFDRWRSARGEPARTVSESVDHPVLRAAHPGRSRPRERDAITSRVDPRVRRPPHRADGGGRRDHSDTEGAASDRRGALRRHHRPHLRTARSASEHGRQVGKPMSMDEYRIVVGVDGSADSHDALAWALEHASTHPSPHLTLVHAWFVPTADGMVGAERFEQLRAAATRVLTDAEHTAQMTAGIAIETRLEYGPAAAAVLTHAADADLVVVGTRGRGRLTSMLLGSVSRAVVTRSEVPVAVVDHATSAPRGPVVVGVDDSPEARSALRWAVAHARRSSLDLKVVHAFQPRHFAGLFGMAKLQPDVAWRAEATAALATLVEMEVQAPLEVELDAIATQAGPADGLLRAAEGASLLVLGTRGCGGAASILLGSVGSEVLKRATCPVVTVPPERVERGQPPLDREAATVSTGASR